MNLLTDKTLIAFEKWMAAAHNICSDYEHAAFFDLPEVCQYALYQEFFDSCGIEIFVYAGINSKNGKRDGVDWFIYVDNCEIKLGCSESRPLALKAAILASDGIFNSKIVWKKVI